MKKYLLGILAMVLAIGFSAFSAVSNQSSKVLDTFYWYDLNGNLLNGGVKTEQPSSGCTTAGTNCAVGFTNQTSTPLIDPPQATRSHNP